MPTKKIPQSIHFQLQKVAKGVYAALVPDDGLAIGNAGIIDLGDQTLIFDTFEDPLCAEDLRLAAETLTGRPATYIINSHMHADHWYGNQVFAPSTPILATPTTFEGMAEFVEEVLEAKDDPSEYEAWLQELTEDLDTATDPLKRQSLETWIRRVRGNWDALATLELRRPNLLFKEALVFQGTQRTAELVTWGGGHTNSDAMIFLPKEKIVFTADICFFHCQPYMGSGHPEKWITQLKRLAATEYKTFVPGHGPVGSREDIQLLLNYFQWLEEGISQALQIGESIEAFLTRSMPAPFAAWSPGGLPAEGNVRMMFERLGGKAN
ncbi:MAG: MBL fold metallo-hydrolase [Chloroflexi bacterium]|nr:MBL fold metallo-hydrolase [Chloroflexota bacterium]